MSYGILEGKFRDIFEEINNRRICKEECWRERNDFLAKDKKGHKCRSNLLLGFSSEKICIPIDVLIVGEAHGGGRPEDFRPQKNLDLDYEVSQIASYYRSLPDKTFHQQQVRILLDRLDEKKQTWVFTDLIKCFVWHGSDKDGKLHSTKNWGTAIEYCSRYLVEQIGFLQPRKILGLGGTVARYFHVDKPRHNKNYRVKINDHKYVYVHSLFPSQWTADQWVVKNGWEPLIPKLAE